VSLSARSSLLANIFAVPSVHLSKDATQRIRLSDSGDAACCAPSCVDLTASRIPRLLSIACFLAISSLLIGCAHHTYTTQAPAPPPQQAPYPQPVPGTQFPAPSAQPSIAPGAYVEEGIASWYGAPFDGRRTSDGEIYNMHEMTAAHRTLPFGSIVQVTDLTNGRRVDVRITDRGPFVANRIIDLSYAAAEALGMVGPGTAPVRLQVVSGPDPTVGFFGVQIGAFEVEANAERLRAGLSARYSPISIVPYDSPAGVFYRVRVGRVPTEAAARELAAQLRATDQLATFVVRLD
jgi:rare lipoprotein A